MEMATLIMNTLARPTGKPHHVFASIASVIISWNHARQTHNSLSRLTDLELDDIGLCRGDIDAVPFGKETL
jgi:uncharacterized protein YjiS (DUF1127 family)